MGEAIANHIAKIGTRLDGVDIHEDLFLPEMRSDQIKQPLGVATTVFSPVADEDSGQSRASLVKDTPDPLSTQACALPLPPR